MIVVSTEKTLVPIEVRWDNKEQTIVRMNIDPPVTWSEFDTAVDESVQMAKSVPHLVFVVLQPNNIPMPRTDNPIPHMQRVFRLLPDNVKLFNVVMGTSGYFERSIINTIGRIAMNKKLRVVSTEEQAYQIIAAQPARV